MSQKNIIKQKEVVSVDGSYCPWDVDSDDSFTMSPKIKTQYESSCGHDNSFFSQSPDLPSEQAKTTQRPSPSKFREDHTDTPIEALLDQLRMQQDLIDKQKDELAAKEQKVKRLQQQIIETPISDVSENNGLNSIKIAEGTSSNMAGYSEPTNYEVDMLSSSQEPSFDQLKHDLRAAQGRLHEISSEPFDPFSTALAFGQSASLASDRSTFDSTQQNKKYSSGSSLRPSMSRSDTWHGIDNNESSIASLTSDSALMPPPPNFTKPTIWSSKRSSSAGSFPWQNSNNGIYGSQNRPGSASYDYDNNHNQNPRWSLDSEPLNLGGRHSSSTEYSTYDWRGYGQSRRNSGYSGTSYGSGQYTPESCASPTMNRVWGPSDSSTMNRTGGSSGAYVPTPIGAPISPTAPEFTPGELNSAWATSQGESSPTSSTYITPVEPLDYRRLLERSVNCNWKYIVEKIVSSNDQQASIFLQQKLKVGTQEQKYAIVDAIVESAYSLMINRFGNFLVQRCFEHGTQQQIDAIAHAIKGKTLQLSMDQFGCHVIQKAFDCVEESIKANMVHELLRRIPETVVHRYACHVWQKLFELRWTDSPPQIMKYVNEALEGRWPEVAIGETGSLVVQNIFENCLEEDKRPCIDEVLANIDMIAHGQFGNWCIQHICEHGAPHDREFAINTVIVKATEYSVDQFASKVVEKCLKVGGTEFVDRYLDRVCEGRHDRPRIPLIDIASDQYGNYLIQHILQTAAPHHREMVAVHIRKHMVSLRGSKFGSRVGMLCSNPNFGRNQLQSSPPNHRYNAQNSRNNWPYRSNNTPPASF